jgi:hypothetical protein
MKIFLEWEITDIKDLPNIQIYEKPNLSIKVKTIQNLSIFNILLFKILNMINFFNNHLYC